MRVDAWVRDFQCNYLEPLQFTNVCQSGAVGNRSQLVTQQSEAWQRKYALSREAARSKRRISAVPSNRAWQQRAPKAPGARSRAVIQDPPCHRNRTVLRKPIVMHPRAICGRWLEEAKRMPNTGWASDSAESLSYVS